MRTESLCIAFVSAAAWAQPQRFVEASDDLALPPANTGRVCFTDLNADGLPDIVYGFYVVLLALPDMTAPERIVYQQIPDALPAPRTGDMRVFADIDNDGLADAVVTRWVDPKNPSWRENGLRTAWMKGNGDGTFGVEQPIRVATPGTTAAVAIGDADLDGRLDLWLGNWFEEYGQSHRGRANDLLLQSSDNGVVFERAPLASDGVEFDEMSDLGGRPTFGALIVNLGWPREFPATLLELNYGRRWNRALHRFSEEEIAAYTIEAERYWAEHDAMNEAHRDAAPFESVQLAARPSRWPLDIWTDSAPAAGLAGDEITHGRHPDWLQIRAAADERFMRADERPFRANGNTFDAAVGDIDNDGDFDLFITEITHAWAGDSSDRSRFLVNHFADEGRWRFSSPESLSVDRIPALPPREQWPEGWWPSWNQGDLFCELADLDNDGRLDLVLSSGDYPDPPPYDERLRIFMQTAGGVFEDRTHDLGVDHIGSQQISIGDVNRDGALDILVGQAFNRFTPEMAESAGGTPRTRLFLNRATQGRKAIVLQLVGDPAQGVNRDAIGAIVSITATINGEAVTQTRQLVGPGGHNGKQSQFIVHAGLGDAEKADRVEIRWPGRGVEPTVMTDVPFGYHRVEQPRIAE